MFVIRRQRLALWLILMTALGRAWASRGSGPSPYLFIWASNLGAGNDFLATIDLQDDSPSSGTIVAKVEVDVKRGQAHHTEHEMTAAGTLFANLFRAGRSYLFDLHQPLSPKVLTHIDNVGPYSHPHSFVRLPDGRILSTFQESGHANTDPGGIVELSPAGEVVNVSPGRDPNYTGFCRPYSLAYSIKLDRIVTTCYDMHKSRSTRAVQIWRLSDLELLKTIELPNGPRGMEGRESGEPRLLPDGVTFYVATFNCGLYRLKDVATHSPRAELVHDFAGQSCALAVITDHYWIQAVDPRYVTALDVSDPARPREVAGLELDRKDDPHWLAREPYGRRIVITGGNPGKTDGLFGRVLIASVDSDGKITLAPHLKDSATGKPGIRLDRAAAHGAVFSIPSQEIAAASSSPRQARCSHPVKSPAGFSHAARACPASVRLPLEHHRSPVPRLQIAHIRRAQLQRRAELRRVR